MSSKTVIEEKIRTLDLRYFSRIELLCGLSTIAELGGLVQKREEMHNLSESVLTKLKDDMKTEIRNFEKTFCESIANTRMLSNSILVKEKAEIGIQSTCDLGEIEIQTEEEEPPTKGKKGAKAPPKKKR